MRPLHARPLRPSLVLAILWLAVVSTVAQTAPPFAPFAQPKVVPTGNWPAAVYTADVNGDGFPDLIYIDQGATAQASTTHVLLNDGRGHFTAASVIATAGSSIVVADFNGDGHPDLAWVVPGSSPNGSCHPGPTPTFTMYLALGNGFGGFFATSTIGAFPTLSCRVMPVLDHLTSAHLRPLPARDLVFEDVAGGVLYTFTTDGTANFTHGTNVNLPAGGGGPVTVADLNGDGIDDLAISALATASADVYLSTGGGYTRQLPPFNPGVGIHSLLLGDVTNDGRPDLIAETQYGSILVFSGNGDGTFASQSIGGTGTLDGVTGNGGHLIALADLNHDGLPDALAVTPIGISALLGNGTAYLGLKGIYNAGPGRTSYATADFNGDGNLDLAVDSPEGIAILFGSADGSFQTSQAFAALRPAFSVALGNFTTVLPPGNAGTSPSAALGTIDAVVSALGLGGTFLRGSPDGSFRALDNSAVFPPILQGWSMVSAGDFDGDGKLDLAYTQDAAAGQLIPNAGTGSVALYGNGDGTFNFASYPSTRSATTCAAGSLLFGNSVVGDFQGLGAANLANRDRQHLRVFVPEGRTLTNTVDIADPGCGQTHNLLAAGPLVTAGRLDLMEQRQGSLLEFLNDGHGNFPQTPAGDLAIDGSLTTPGQLTAPDLSATFGGVSQALSYPAAVGSMVIADLDGDGNRDLLVLYANVAADLTDPAAGPRNWLYVWYGSGNGKFLTSAAHPQNPVCIQPSRDFYEMTVGRFDANNPRPLIAMSDGYVLSLGTLGAEMHFLAGQGINSLSAGDLRNLGTGVQDLVVANGGLTLSNPVANHETLTPNPDVNTGGITVLLNQSKPLATPQGTLIATPEPSYIGEPFTLTVTSPSNNSVTFFVDGVQVGTQATQANGQASIAGPTTLALGSHALTALVTGTLGNPTHQIAGTHNVVLSPTTTTLTPSTPLTVYYGQAIDGRFAVQVLDANHPANGTYSVEDNGVDVAPCIGLAITATCPYGNPSLVDAGTHALTVHYLGDAFNAPSLSDPVVFNVVPDITSATLTSSLNPANFGQPVLFSVQITGNYAVPNCCTIELYDGATPLAGNSLDSNGSAGNTVSTLSIGTHSITVSYPGAKNFNPVVSAPLLEQILLVQTPLASAVTLSSSLNPAAPGQPVTFTASVAIADPLHPLPTAGTVTFSIDGTALPAVGLDSAGHASLLSPQLTSGSHTVVAAYSGSPGLTIDPVRPPLPPQPPSPRASSPNPQPVLASISAPLTELITYSIAPLPQGFRLTVTPTPVTIGAGRTAILLVAVAEFSGFNQPVALSCSGLPTETACSFIQPVIPAGGGSTTLALATASPHDCGDPAHPYFLGRNTPPAGAIPVLAAAGVLLGLGRKRRLLRGVAWLLLLGGGLYSVSGCGHCTDLGTRPGSYTFTVTATPQGGTAAAQSQAIPLTVTIP